MTRELRRWTESELQYLRTHYGWVTNKQLAHDLVLEAAVTRAHGNQSEAARTMGIHRRTIQMALARIAQHRRAQRHENPQRQ